MSAASESQPALSLADRLVAWQGDEAEAMDLRGAVQAQERLRLGAGAPPVLRGLAKACELYANAKRQPRSLASWLSRDDNFEAAQVFRPLLGDQAMGVWPHDAPFVMSESELVTWCRIFWQHPPVVDDRVRRLIGVAFQIRRRQTWPEACRAWARLALEDDELRERLRRLWAMCFPNPVTQWPKTGLSSARRTLFDGGTKAVHLIRHTLFLGCCWRAVGGDPELAGIDPDWLASMALPRDDADRSVIVMALTELVGPHREVMESALVARSNEVGAEELTESAFRGLHDALPPGGARDAIRASLLKPRWKPGRVDALWEWLNTAAWFQAAGDDAALETMRESAGVAIDALTLRLGMVPEGVVTEILVERLERLLNRDRLAVTAKPQLASLLAEIRLWMHLPEAQSLPWGSLVRLAIDDSQLGMLEGTVAEVAEPSLCGLLAERRLTSRTLMRDVELSPQHVLALGRLQDGFIAGQVAVQTERILREATKDSDRVRFLWQLLQQDPPYKTFQELGLVLRTDFALPTQEPPSDAGEDTPLHAMVNSVSTLDRHRDEGSGIEEIAKAFADLVRCTKVILKDNHQGRDALDQLANAFLAAVDHDTDPLADPNWFGRLEDVVIGRDPRGGLVGWGWWLGLTAEEEAGLGNRDDSLSINTRELAIGGRPRGPRGELAERRRGTERALGRLRTAVTMLRSAQPTVTVDQHEELVAAAKALQTKVGTLGWPEKRLMDTLLERLEGRSEEALAHGRQSAAAVKQLHRLMETADDKGIGAMIRDRDQLALLPVDEIRRVHLNFLGQLRFRDAAMLRRTVADRCDLPSRFSYLMPLFAAVGGGTFLVLDVGESWLALVEKEAWWGYAATVGLTLLASFGLLLSDLAPRVPQTSESPQRRYARLAVRALPTFVQASAVSLFVSAIAMATLKKLPGPNAIPTLVLWSSLALFLGVFIGLILQGQSATRDRDVRR
ncbi:MAG: hypothetical protein AAGA48_32415 [Myxococcota bacterium]